jgi:hypothetical protein
VPIRPDVEDPDLEDPDLSGYRGTSGWQKILSILLADSWKLVAGSFLQLFATFSHFFTFF